MVAIKLVVTHLRPCITNSKGRVMTRVYRVLMHEPRVPKLNWKNRFHFQCNEPAVPNMGLLAKLPNFVISLLVYQISLVVIKMS